MRLIFPWTAAREFDRLSEQLTTIEAITMATKQEVETKLQAINEALGKVQAESAESVRLIEELKAQVGNSGDIPDSITALIDQVAAKVSAVDALVADAAPQDPGTGTGTDPENPGEDGQPAGG